MKTCEKWLCEEKTQIGAYRRDGLVRIAKKALCLLGFFFEDKIDEVLARLLLEFFEEAGAAHEQHLGDLLRRDGLAEVVADIVHDVHHELGRGASHSQLLHTLGVVKDHVILQVGDTRVVAQKFALLDIAVAQGGGVVDVHASADGGAGGERRRDDEGILHLPQLVGGQNFPADGRHGQHPLLQALGVAEADEVDERLLQSERIAHVEARFVLLRKVGIEILVGLRRFDDVGEVLLLGV